MPARLLCFTKDVFSMGLASVWRLARWPCQGTRQDFGRVFTSSRGDALPRQCIDGISPRGGGADGEGMEHPPRLLS